ncbi:MAG: aminotransferase class I/II-fold pyridoxal phosphate-dependent enzyme [Actinomyces sp.]|nr:aminotransferase class I/II-fold pyridoxal phosphate-dependent enzyme [Actinomyces sp.]
MSIQTRTDDELHRIGSLKWAGITTTDGSPTIGAWVAEMDFGTAPEVASAMKQAIDDGLLGYQPPWIAPRVAEALAEYQHSRFGWDLPTSHIRLAESVLPALRATLDHLVRPGSLVIVPTPAYMPFLTIPARHHHDVIEVPSLHGRAAGEHSWTLDLEGIRAGLEAGAGLVILCNPWNPTGRVLTEQEMRDLQALVSQYDALVFSDEIHSPLVLDDTATPFLSYARLGAEFASHTITATAASKGWNIAGLPCAQVILPDDSLRERWDAFGSDIAHGASTIGALGTIAAYTDGVAWQQEVLDHIRANVALVDAALADTPIDFAPPEATYLTWWGFERLGLEPNPATVLRERARIAVNAGRTLGTGWEQWARVNLACSRHCAEEIVERTLALLP